MSPDATDKIKCDQVVRIGRSCLRMIDRKFKLGYTSRNRIINCILDSSTEPQKMNNRARLKSIHMACVTSMLLMLLESRGEHKMERYLE